MRTYLKCLHMLQTCTPPSKYLLPPNSRHFTYQWICHLTHHVAPITPDLPHTVLGLHKTYTHATHAYIPSPTSTPLHTHISQAPTHATPYAELIHSTRPHITSMFQDGRLPPPPPPALKPTPWIKEHEGNPGSRSWESWGELPWVTVCFPGGQALV